MSSYIPINKNPNFSTITFDDRSVLSSAHDYDSDVRYRKRLRVDGDSNFEKNVNIMENLRIGMYASRSYFFDVNDRKFYEYKYTLKESYKLSKTIQKKFTRKI